MLSFLAEILLGCLPSVNLSFIQVRNRFMVSYKRQELSFGRKDYFSFFGSDLVKHYCCYLLEFVVDFEHFYLLPTKIYPNSCFT
jgi:hypothetical protein